MVPSDPRSSATAGRHARPRSWPRKYVVFPLPSLPAAAFDCHGSKLRRRSAPPPRLGLRLEAAFRSPGLAVRFRTSSPGSPFPACLFSTAPDRFHARSVPDSPPRRPVSRRGADLDPSPVACRASGAPASSPRSASLRDLSIPPDRRSPQFTVRSPP